MTKMRTKVMLTVMAAMSMVAACGMDVTPTNPDTTVAAKTVETVTDLAHKVNEAVAATEVMTTEETTVEETTAEETTAEETTEMETTAAEESTEETTATPKVETKAAPKAETKAETKAAPKAEAPKAPEPTQAAPAPTQAPAHTHQWKEHKATREEWVPNIVSVPDYEVQEITMGYIVCNCGAEFRWDDPNAAMHNAMHGINDEPDNYSTVVRVIGSEEVQVGSHEEDHGHYESVEYTDYMYCECGATK